MKSILMFLCLLLSPISAFAEGCPVSLSTEGFLDKVIAAIKASADCDAAYSIAGNCALGAAGDTETTLTAERKCGLDFWKKLTAEDKKQYNRLQAICDKKYAGMDGSMYVSQAAFCRLNVAQLYSRLYSPVE